PRRARARRGDRPRARVGRPAHGGAVRARRRAAGARGAGVSDGLPRYRTHTCGELRAQHTGATAWLSGWIHRKRDHGGLRFLDLRREKLHRNILLRSHVIASIRRRMIAAGFTEFQTPILTSSSPEGARDYVVPSRVHPGKFYALPQAPQQFKQLLMVAGFD